MGSLPPVGDMPGDDVMLMGYVALKSPVTNFEAQARGLRLRWAEASRLVLEGRCLVVGQSRPINAPLKSGIAVTILDSASPDRCRFDD